MKLLTILAISASLTAVAQTPQANSGEFLRFKLLTLSDPTYDPNYGKLQLAALVDQFGCNTAELAAIQQLMGALKKERAVMLSEVSAILKTPPAQQTSAERSTLGAAERRLSERVSSMIGTVLGAVRPETAVRFLEPDRIVATLARKGERP